jgi:hypothetical protein
MGAPPCRRAPDDHPTTRIFSLLSDDRPVCDAVSTTSTNRPFGKTTLSVELACNRLKAGAVLVVFEPSKDEAEALRLLE